MTYLGKTRDNIEGKQERKNVVNQKIKYNGKTKDNSHGKTKGCRNSKTMDYIQGETKSIIIGKTKETMIGKRTDCNSCRKLNIISRRFL